MNSSKRKPDPWKPATEVELLAPVVDRLIAEGLDVHPERRPGEGADKADIVALDREGGRVLVYEGKLGLTLRVVAQGLRHRPHATDVYLVVPASAVASLGNTLEQTFDVLRQLGLGLVAVSGPDPRYVRIVLPAPTTGRSPHRPAPLRPGSDDARHACAAIPPSPRRSERPGAGVPAGSPGGADNSSTPEAVTLDRLREAVARNGPSKLTLLVREIDHHYLTDRDAVTQLRRLLTKRGVPGLRYRGGKVVAD